MITEGEKKYLEHAIELAEFIEQKNMSGNLKSEILDKMLIPYGLSDEKKNGGLPKQEPAKQPQNSQPKPVNEVKPQTAKTNVTNPPNHNVDFNPEKKEPATDKQKNYIESLMNKLNKKIDDSKLENLSKSEASKEIDKLSIELYEILRKQEKSIEMNQLLQKQAKAKEGVKA